MKKPLIRLVVILVIGIVVLGGVLFYFSTKRADDIKKFKAEGTQKLQGTDLFKQDNAYFMQIFNHAQPLAAKQVDSLLKPSVSENDYYIALLSQMARKAKADNKEDIAKKLRTYGTGRGWIFELD